MSDKEMATERLVLRRIAERDVPALHMIFSDPETMRYWSTLPHCNSAVTEAWVAKTMAEVGGGQADEFAILLNGTLIGKAGLWRGSEIGVILSRTSQGQGYAAEALSAVISRAFSRGIDRITADVDPRNAASLRLFEKLGFRNAGYAKATFLLGEVWADSVYLALTPDGWPPART